MDDNKTGVAVDIVILRIKLWQSLVEKCESTTATPEKRPPVDDAKAAGSAVVSNANFAKQDADAPKKPLINE